MKNLALALLFMTMASLPTVKASENANSEKGIPLYMSYCMHFGTGVSPSFSSCVNSNNSSIARVFNAYFSQCYNFGNEVSSSFVSCVNDGFREAERRFNHSIYLSYCMNFDRTSLDSSFVSCVNSNYGTIQRAAANL